MFRILKTELKKAFGNKLFLITLAIGLIIGFVSAYQNISNYVRAASDNAYRMEVSEVLFNPLYPMFSSFTNWMGGDLK